MKTTTKIILGVSAAALATAFAAGVVRELKAIKAATADADPDEDLAEDVVEEVVEEAAEVAEAPVADATEA